jgi:hypothetical protein
VIGALGGWVRTLIALALLANVVDWLMPPGELRRYAALVAGLVMTAALVGPVAGLVKGLGQGGEIGRWLGVVGGPPLGAVIARQQAAEVEAVVETLPGVDTATVRTRHGMTLVRIRVQGHVAAGLREAAQAAVEEVMTVPAERVRIVVESGAAGPAAPTR